MTPLRTLIFVPTYNENRNVERLCAELRAPPLDADILFIDDGSRDGTGPTLNRLAGEHPRISVVHREGKLGMAVLISPASAMPTTGGTTGS
jgi:dolichol-phosphate mannosyltransferase